MLRESEILPGRLFLKAVIAGLALLFSGFVHSVAQDPGPLPSWSDGKAKAGIVTFISDANTIGHPGFIPSEKRIALFDLDGTLWAEDPIVQLIFSIERLKAQLPDHPEWNENNYVTMAMKADIRSIEQEWDSAFAVLTELTSVGLTETEYAAEVNGFLTAATHPKFHRLFKETGYLPMKELLSFLAENGFTTYILARGASGFARAFSQEVFCIPPDRVIEDYSALPNPPSVTCANARHRGDLEMLLYSQEHGPRSLEILINHDDMSREYYYGDRDGKAAAAAGKYGWIVVSMRKDWKKIFSL